MGYRLLLLVSLLFTSLVCAHDGGLQLNQQMPEAEYKDQYDREHMLPGSAQILLFTESKRSGQLVMKVLEGMTEADLKAKGIVYLTSAGTTSSFLADMFGLPNVSRLPYPVLLDEEGMKSEAYPHQRNQVSVIRLSGGVIEQIEFTDKAETLKQLLAL